MKKKPFNLEKAAYEQIKRSILSGEMKPGDRLLEEELSAKLSMSRTPIRKAMQRLESEMILENVEGKTGMQIYKAKESDINDITDIRTSLEKLAIMRGMQDGNLEKYLPMRGTIDALKIGFENKDITALIEADDAFHKIIFDNCGSNMLRTMGMRINDCHNLYNIVYLRSHDDSWIDTHNQHLMIYNLIMSGNAFEAANMLDYHITHNKWKSDGYMSMVLGSEERL